jgi:hypothetical protein
LERVEGMQFESINLDGSGDIVSEEGKSKEVAAKSLNSNTTIFDCLDRF